MRASSWSGRRKQDHRRAGHRHWSKLQLRQLLLRHDRRCALLRENNARDCDRRARDRGRSAPPLNGRKLRLRNQRGSELRLLCNGLVDDVGLLLDNNGRSLSQSCRDAVKVVNCLDLGLQSRRRVGQVPRQQQFPRPVSSERGEGPHRCCRPGSAGTSLIEATIRHVLMLLRGVGDEVKTVLQRACLAGQQEEESRETHACKHGKQILSSYSGYFLIAEKPSEKLDDHSAAPPQVS